MTHHTQSPLVFANLAGKKVQADFEAGSLSSDGGLLFLRTLEAQIGITRRLSEAIVDHRHPSYIDHSYHDLIRQRVFQIAWGYEDANDCTTWRDDPAFKAACNRLPLSADPLASQPTMTRLENTASKSDRYHMTRALLDAFVDS